MIGAGEIGLLGVHVVFVLSYVKGGGVPRVIGARQIGLLGVHIVIVLRYMKGVYQGDKCILNSVFRSTCRDCT